MNANQSRHRPCGMASDGAARGHAHVHRHPTKARQRPRDYLRSSALICGSNLLLLSIDR